MSATTDRLSKARLDLHYAEIEASDAEYHLANLELRVRHRLITEADGDYKKFGPNETAQKSEIAYQIAQDADVETWQIKLRNAQQMTDRCRVELDCALDERRDHETTLRREYIDIVGGSMGGEHE